MVVAFALTTAALAVIPAVASAAITVNGTGDLFAVDGQCTLREAITAANTNAAVNECAAGTAGADTIVFSALFTGTVGTSTITTSGEPAITEKLNIDGGNCGPLFSPKPCVGLDVSPSGSTAGLDVQAADVTIRGLAITNASKGVNTTSDGLSVKGSWLGVKLDQSAAGNVTGLMLRAANATIGGTLSADRNVIAANSSQGIRIETGDTNTIEGNYIGTKPDGTAGAGTGNAIGIQIVGNSNPDPATGNVVGGLASTPGGCDGACNLISNNSGPGIDLQGGGGADAPADATTVKGNFIGLDLAGSGDLGNSGLGIGFGDATNTTVGGASAQDRNYIAGNDDWGVYVGPNATGSTVQNNFIGTNAAGTAAVPNNVYGIASQATAQLMVTNNRFGGNSLLLDGGNAVAKGNVIGEGPGGQALGGFATAPLLVGGDGNQVGGTNPGDANTIGNYDATGDAALRLEEGSSNNVVLGNLIGVDSLGRAIPNAGYGIWLATPAPVTNTQIGGSTAASENVISNTGHDAIRIEADTSDGNSVLRNRGRNNGSGVNDLFIDLIGAEGPGNGASGPNNGIEAPSIDSVSTTAVSGSGAVANADIRVFSTFTVRDDVKAFLGQTVANGTGHWSFTYPSALAIDACVTVTQTDGSGNTSEMPTAQSVLSGDCDTTPPTVTIDSGPTGPTKDATPTFGFSADETATFECRFDSEPFAVCSGPGDQHTPAAPLADGPHTFAVRGTDQVGNTSDPETQDFTVDTVAPKTKITDGPPNKTSKDKARFKFKSNESHSKFKCSLDGKKPKSCDSPKTYKNLDKGRHDFEVFAIDAAGNRDQSPAGWSWKIKG
jgi:trimeric autotransporter adhesin